LKEEEEDSWYYKGAEAVRLFDLTETWDFYSDILSPRRGAAKRIKKLIDRYILKVALVGLAKKFTFLVEKKYFFFRWLAFS
jgi:hypothetical protein